MKPCNVILFIESRIVYFEWKCVEFSIWVFLIFCCVLWSFVIFLFTMCIVGNKFLYGFSTEYPIVNVKNISNYSWHFHKWTLWNFGEKIFSLHSKFFVYSSYSENIKIDSWKSDVFNYIDRQTFEFTKIKLKIGYMWVFPRININKFMVYKLLFNMIFSKLNISIWDVNLKKIFLHKNTRTQKEFHFI